MSKGTKKKRIRSPHPGVYIFKRKHPSGRTTWRGKYIDPKTERWVFVSLDRLKKTNDDLRKEWAVNKSKEITNLCRCGTYNRIHAAILEAARRMPTPTPPEEETP